MGTRGVYGFRIEDRDYLRYNQFDSYPNGLGVAIAKEIQGYVDYDALKSFLRDVVLYDEDVPPNEIDGQLQSAGYTQDSIYEIRMTLEPWLNKKITYFPDNKDFIKDGLFCEWGYIINLDRMEFEVWKGFQKKPHSKNRYGTECNDGYYPCKMVKKFKLSESNLPELIKKVAE